MNRFLLVFISVSMAISDWSTYLARIYLPLGAHRLRSHPICLFSLTVKLTLS